MKNDAPLTLQQRLALVKRELVEAGIGKNSKQKFQNYDYRGVDQVLGVISALHVKHGVNLKVNAIEDFRADQRTDVKGKPFTHMTALFEWEFQNSDDAKDFDRCWSIGEGMDSSDKSSGKMQSYAYKTMMFYRYEIPVSGQPVDDYDPRIDNESSSVNDEGDDEGTDLLGVPSANSATSAPSKTVGLKAMLSATGAGVHTRAETDG